jgi:tetratricopeptide (TPR) repeat protein
LELNRNVKPVDCTVEALLNWRLSNADLHLYQHAFMEALEETQEGLDQFPNAAKLGLRKARLLIDRSHAALQCGQEALGLATADEASAILRTEKDQDPATAFHYLGMLGWYLWEGGCPGRAAILITESIRGLEPLDAANLANRLRLCLAYIHREEGRHAQAACVLPKWERVSEGQRRFYFAERGSIRQKAGRLADALRDAWEVLRLAVESGDSIDIASARSNVAEVLLEDGQLAEAESEAQEAYREFTTEGYPDKAGVCVTLGLLGDSAEYFAEAERIVSELPFLTASARARFRKTMAERLAKFKEHAVVPEVEAVAAVSANPAVRAVRR